MAFNARGRTRSLNHFLRAALVSNAKNYVSVVACTGVMSLGQKECWKVDPCSNV